MDSSGACRARKRARLPEQPGKNCQRVLMWSFPTLVSVMRFPFLPASVCRALRALPTWQRVGKGFRKLNVARHLQHARAGT